MVSNHHGIVKSPLCGHSRKTAVGSSAAGRLAVSYAASLSLGRPPRVPFSRDALALAALRAEPPKLTDMLHPST